MKQHQWKSLGIIFLLLNLTTLGMADALVGAGYAFQEHRVYQMVGCNYGWLDDHTELDSGFSQEYTYGIRKGYVLDLRGGLFLGPPKVGLTRRYYLAYRAHLPLPQIRDVSFGLTWHHHTYEDIHIGENAFFFHTQMETRFFYFKGGILTRFPLLDGNYRNPFSLPTEASEVVLLFDLRGRYEHALKEINGAVIQVGLGVMNFLGSDTLGSNTVGYMFFGTFDHPKVGLFELKIGLMSYSFWDNAGYYGRIFAYFSYCFRWQV